MLFAAIAAFLAFPATAMAYDELTPATGKNCNDCHGLESGFTSPTVAPTRKGPHGGYGTGTNKCKSCHSVHDAPEGGVLLLPAATVKATCETCHDGTGGNGVYGVLAARGVAVAARHRIDVTRVVPGGDPAGGDITSVFNGISGNLTCSDCHSPHDAQTVDPFSADRARNATDTTYPLAPATNRMLKKRPTSGTADVTKYGSSWCGACHKGRLSGSAGLINHPVETETAGFNYDNIARTTGANVSTTQMGSLGGSNFGYVMPIAVDGTRTALQEGHGPICQQCHEDGRTVGDDPLNTQRVSTENGFNEVFRVTDSDGKVATDNPRFQTFPHESEKSRFLVETDDDLCMNCHIKTGS